MKTNKNPVVSGVTKVADSIEVAWKRTPAKRLWLGLGVVLLVAAVAVSAVAYRRLPHSTPLDAVRQAMSAPTLADLQKEVRQNPRSAQAHVALGQAYFDKGQHAQALAEFEHALNLDPKVSSAPLAADLVACFGTPQQSSAANVIGTYRIVEAQEGLERLTASKQYAVRLAALNTLEKIGRASHSDFLHVWTLDLEVPDCDVRRHAIARLGELGDRRALQSVHDARMKDDQETPWYKFRCIGSRSDDAEKRILAHNEPKPAAKATVAIAHK